MENLSAYCINFSAKICHPDVIASRSPRELKNGQQIPVWPAGPELKKYDNLCRACAHRKLHVDEKKCPMCDSDKVEISGGSHTVMAQPRQMGHKCLDCGEYFWISESIIKK
jgi:hypothetical protein